MSEAAARDFERRWALTAVPLRPAPAVAETMAALIADRPGTVLQLGVTPEQGLVAASMIAADWNEAMVRLAGAGGGRRAIVADWRALPLADASIAAAIGDGALNVLRWPEPALWGELARVLVPRARIVIRCFVQPAVPEPLEALRAAALAGQGGGFAAFKLRFNMAVAAAEGRGAVSSDRLFRAFQALFPDRAALARANGWREAILAQVDAYAGSPALHAYPDAAAILAAVPWPARLMAVGNYELAGRCPLLVVDVPA